MNMSKISKFSCLSDSASSLSSFGDELSAREPSLSKSDILQRRYRILMRQNLSEGHGAIYFCNDLWDNSPCVIKELPYKLGEGKSSFRDEAIKMAKLPSHKNVVKLLRIEAIGDSFFAVMEWLPQSMRRRLMNISEFKAEDILKVAISICDGMLHCIEYLSNRSDHGRKHYIHGDLKPENLLISDEGNIKIADFGGGQTDKYASPEQKLGVREDKLDERSDIFSIGVILDEMCGSCRNEKFVAQMKRITLMCCEYDIEKRPQSMEKLYDLLAELYEEYLGERPKRYKSTDDSGIDKINRCCNLAILGEDVDIYRPISDIFLYSKNKTNALVRASLRIAEIYERRKMYNEAIGCYNFGIMYGGNEHPELWTGMSRACFELSQFEEALTYSTKALEMRMSKSEPNKVELDYSATRINIMSLHELGRAELLKNVQDALIATYLKIPTQFEAIKYIAYTYYFQKDYKNAIYYFDKYLAYVKDDYEMLYFYAFALYTEFDTTKSRAYFKRVIELINSSTNPEISSNQCAILAVSYYCINELNEAQAYIDQYRDKYGKLPRKLEILEQLIPDDWASYAYYKMLNARIGQVGESFQTVERNRPSEYYSALIEIIRQNRNEWKLLSMDLSFSYQMRWSNLCSFTREFFIFIAADRPKEALEAIETALSYDRSSPITLLNKAELLFMGKLYSYAIPLYREALKYQENPQMINQIERRLAMVEDIIKKSHEGRTSFLDLLMEKAASWNGTQQGIMNFLENYRFMFDRKLCSDLVTYTCEKLNAILDGKENGAILRNITFCLGTMQQLGELIFIDTAIQIYDILIDAGREHTKIFPNIIGICLSFRGLAYFEKSRLTNQPQLMDYAISDFQGLLETSIVQTPYMLRGAYDNIANFYLNKKTGDIVANLRKAKEFFSKALTLLNNTNAQNDIARIKSNYGVCLFELGEHKQSIKMINEALGYITIENDPIFFANTEMMLGTVSLFLLGVKGEIMSSFEGILFEGIEAYRKALIVYNLKDYPKKYGSIMLEPV